MQLSVRFRVPAWNPIQARRFLLLDRTLNVSGWCSNGRFINIPVTVRPDGFTFELIDVLLNRIEVDFAAFFTRAGRRMDTLRIVQRFGLTRSTRGVREVILLPSLWVMHHAGNQRLMTATTNTTPFLHPLLRWDAKNKLLEIDAPMVVHHSLLA